MPGTDDLSCQDPVVKAKGRAQRLMLLYADKLCLLRWTYKSSAFQLLRIAYHSSS
jgi:hypothetical protein